MASKFFGSTSTVVPALLISTSRRPNSFSVAASMARTDGVVTDIAAVEQRARARALAFARGDLRRLFAAAEIDDHVVTIFRQRHGGATADAGG